MNTEFEQYQNLMKAMAYKYHVTTGIDLEELTQETYLGFCECLNQYKPIKGDLKPYITTCIHNKLRSYLKANYRHYLANKNSFCLSLYELEDQDVNPVHFKNKFMNHKNKIIREIYTILTQTKLPKKKGYLYGWLDKKLNEIGYVYSDIWSSFKEVKRILNEV